MCKVILNNPKDNVEFIIYNHLFSKENYNFTVAQLVEDLNQYNLDLTPEFVQEELDAFVRSGLVNQNFRCYSCVR